MRHSKEEKAASRQRILNVASERIRESGTDGPGVAEIMSAAGLTHGGFYKHFDSRDDLVAEALAKTFADTETATESLLKNAADPLATFVDAYASIAHCQDPGTGCAIVSLGADVARGDDRLRGVYREQVERYLAHLEQLLGPGDDARRTAIVALSTLVGAVLVARAVDDQTLAEEILKDVRAAVKSSHPR
jgi:TetR/AcrR family transcriptional repressor of nem operon